MDQNRQTLTLTGQDHQWLRTLATHAGLHVSSCYQCLRCTNSCPVSQFMDIKPHQLVRFVQLGQQQRLLRCSAIWICLSCEMCSTYCPNEIDVARLFNHLKNTVASARLEPAEYEIAVFHQVFLDVLRKNGRINELQLLQRYKWKTIRHGNIPTPQEMLSELKLSLDLLRRGRLRLLPEKSPAAGEIRQIVRARAESGESP